MPDQESPDVFDSVLTRGVEYALRVREQLASQPGADALAGACIVASAIDAHREALQYLASSAAGPLSRAERDHAEQVTEVLVATQSTLSALNDARNKAIGDLQRFVELANDPRSSLDGHVEMVRAVIDELKRAGAPKSVESHGG